MNSFTYTRAGDVAGAVREIVGDKTAKFIAGGTNLIDLMKENVMRPNRLVDISRLALTDINSAAGGGLRLGALARNTERRVSWRGRAPLSAALEGYPGRRIAAAPQHGDCWRQSDATDPLLLFLRYGHAL